MRRKSIRGEGSGRSQNGKLMKNGCYREENSGDGG